MILLLSSRNPSLIMSVMSEVPGVSVVSEVPGVSMVSESAYGVHVV